MTFSDRSSSVVVRRSSSVNFYKLNLNSKTTEGISMKLDGNVQYPALTKCCYFSSHFEIKYGRHGSHLEKPISNLNSSSTGGIPMKLDGNNHYPSLTECCCFSSCFEIQYGHHGSHLEKPISNLNSSSTEGIPMKLDGNVQ